MSGKVNREAINFQKNNTKTTKKALHRNAEPFV